MADAIEVLTGDHRVLNELFDQVTTAGAPPGVINSIVKELSVHDAIEKIHLYPAVRDRVAGGQEMAEQAIVEHGEVARTLLEIDRRDANDPAMPELLTSLRQMVREHVDEEEAHLFPGLRRVMTSDELEELGAELEKGKKSAPTRPHPHAPSAGASTKLAGAAAAPLDKLRDKIQGRR